MQSSAAAVVGRRRCNHQLPLRWEGECATISCLLGIISHCLGIMSCCLGIVSCRLGIITSLCCGKHMSCHRFSLRS